MESENNFTNTTPREDEVLLPEESDVQNIDTTYQTEPEIKETSPYWYLFLALVFDIVGLGLGFSLINFLNFFLLFIFFTFTQVLAIYFALASIIQAFRSHKINQMDRKSRLDDRLLIIALVLLQLCWSGFCIIIYIALRNWN